MSRWNRDSVCALVEGCPIGTLGPILVYPYVYHLTGCNQMQGSEAMLLRNARVFFGAIISGSAIVTDYVTIRGESVITDHARIGGECDVWSSLVGGHARIEGWIGLHRSTIAECVRIVGGTGWGVKHRIIVADCHLEGDVNIETQGLTLESQHWWRDIP